jgi:hemolysin activation/secretion protein
VRATLNTKRANFGHAAAVVAVAAAALASPPAARADDDNAQRIEERLPDNKQQLPDAPATSKPGPITVDQDDLAAIPRFLLKSVNIVGLSAIDKSEAEQCASSLVGKTIGAASLIQLTDCITDLYRAQGFFLSRAIVPKQLVQDGMLKVHAIETYVAGIESEGISPSEAREQFQDTLGERPIRLATFERDLLLLADHKGYRVASSQLLPDPNDPARFTFKVKVVVSSFNGRLLVDNRGSGESGSDQAFGSFAWNSLATGGDRLQASLFTEPSDPEELFYGEISYTRPWLEGALWTDAGTSMSRSHRDNALPGDIADSESDRFYARVSAPLLRSRVQSLWASIMFDGRDATQTTSLATLSDERLRTLRGSFSYTLVKGATRADIAIEASHGLDTFGASRNDATLLTRPDARPQFSKVRLDAAVTRKLADRWDATLYLAGQHADGALVSVEEFGVGGARYGRAYNYSEITGDDGAAIALEVRYTLANLTDWLKSVQIYAFVDGAMIWNRASDPSALSEADLSSAGLGVRLTPVQGITAGIELAQPLSRDVAETGDRNLRPFFTLQMGW